MKWLWTPHKTNFLHSLWHYFKVLENSSLFSLCWLLPSLGFCYTRTAEMVNTFYKFFTFTKNSASSKAKSNSVHFVNRSFFLAGKIQPFFITWVLFASKLDWRVDDKRSISWKRNGGGFGKSLIYASKTWGCLDVEE